MNIEKKQRRPHWLKVKLPGGNAFTKVKSVVNNGELHTVCQSARCPNIGECWGRQTATFMIMGDLCTRNCRFCAVNHGKPEPLDENEPIKIARAVKHLGLRYAVITSVTRDDLDDGGARHFAETIRAVKKLQPECRVEVLIPDLQGDKSALKTVLDAQPDVLNHNIETVPRLYPQARPQADFNRSIELLKRSAELGARTKTGIMVGLGETEKEILDVFEILVSVNCKILTIGQYLQPGPEQLPIHEFIHPDQFAILKNKALELGFEHVESGPLVRSSYHADEQVKVLDGQK